MFEISGRKIGLAEPPYIVAELSANHGGCIERAKLAIRKAKEGGADAVKIQSYTPDTMTIDCKKDEFMVTTGLWTGFSLYDLYTKAHTPFEWHEELFTYAKDENITIFSSPFDESAIELLQDLNSPAYKIASFELVDLPLIRSAAETGKPLLMSTGMAGLVEIEEALETAMKYGCGDVLLFHCISSYPTPVTESNLRNIVYLRRNFGVEVGLSDHTIGNLAAIIATGLGASAIEKHFKPTDDVDSLDAEFSINPAQLETLVKDCHDAWNSLGNANFGRSDLETESLKYRRSLYFINDLKAGDTITANDIKAIRPGFGIAPKYFDAVLGRSVVVDVSRGEPVSFHKLSA